MHKTETTTNKPTKPRALLNWIVTKTSIGVAIVIAITAALAIPFLTMAPTETASTEPEGPVIEARDTANERFSSSVFDVFFTIESPTGNLLQANELTDLLAAQNRIRTDVELAPNSFTYFSPEFETEVDTIFSLADAVALELEIDPTTTNPEWTDDQIQTATKILIEKFGEESPLLGLSTQSTQDAAGDWVVPAISSLALYDNNVLGFGNASVTLGADTAPEEFSRQVQETLREDNNLVIFGTAIDVNLTSAEQGELAGPFIGFTILAVVLIVGYTFRSYWAVAVTGVAFSILLVWLKGISNAVGFKEDLVLSLIVPIAMVSFGVDFIFHALGRYREEAAEGKRGILAITGSLVAISGALTLALVSDATAFLSNTISGIESINQFGIGAAIALASAYVLLGYIAPIVIARIEQKIGHKPRRGKARVATVLGSILAGMFSMTTVLFLVFIEPKIGILLLIATTVLTIIIPLVVAVRKADETPTFEPVEPFVRAGKFFEKLTTAIAGRPAFTTITALAVTIGTTFMAFQVPVAFDVEDFFASDTGFVQGLNQIEKHVGERGGESAELLVTGDLTSIENLTALSNEIEKFKKIETENYATNVDGVLVEGGILEVFEKTFSSPIATTAIKQSTGVQITDTDKNGIPDSKQQVEALISFGTETGIPFSNDQLVLTPDDVSTKVDLATDNDATLFSMFLVNSREQSTVTAASDQLDDLSSNIEEAGTNLMAQGTGGPFVRNASLKATSDALLISLPIAVLVCFLIATIVLKSIRLGLISVAPILMVVSWLYAIMYLLGFSINLVTATIAAISVGIGIDFAIHYIVRFVEETNNNKTLEEALRATSASTGIALAASATSSIIGFGILALAPMPLFASYGLLTALMIFLALLSTFTVLPGLLALGAKSK